MFVCITFIYTNICYNSSMCGQYILKDDIGINQYKAILSEMYDQETIDLLKCGDIAPSNLCLVRDENFNIDIMKWQYKLFGRNLVNIRSESIKDKDLYKEDYQSHKCVILANGFYEWDTNHQRYYIHTNDSACYFAGIYQIIDGKKNFTIITRKATTTLKIHNRVPIVLNKRQAIEYLQSNDDYSFFDKYQPELTIETSFENLSLFDEDK